MDAPLFLPDSSVLRLESVSVVSGVVEIFVTSARPVACCPACGHPAARVHSRYQRTLQDLSWQGRPVRIRWRTRRFFCDTPGCPQRIFTEHVPTVARRYGRRTFRCQEAALCLGLIVGGEEGARVAKYLGFPLSGDTLLRVLRRTPRPPIKEPRVIGVDDWALRRGQTYGTLIIDLERHQPLELLADRKWETFRDWLAQHPAVEVVSRDRARCYAHGALAGAPHATQVADRWHLLQNLREALKKLAERFLPEIWKAVRETSDHQATARQPTPTPDNLSQATAQDSSAAVAPAKNCGDFRRELRRSRRVERFEQVHELQQEGHSQREIARILGLSRKTVRRFLHSESFPERAMRQRAKRFAAIDQYLARRWREGNRNARILAAELQHLGYDLSYYSVRRTVASWRDRPHSRRARSTTEVSRKTRNARPLSSKQISWLLFLSPDEMEQNDQALAEAVQGSHQDLRLASELARALTDIVKHRRPSEVRGWIDRATTSTSPQEIQRFARGLLSEYDTIAAALALPWSNGQTEGQINRLKLVKRQMYGRAKLDLLGQRFLGRSAFAPFSLT